MGSIRRRQTLNISRMQSTGSEDGVTPALFVRRLQFIPAYMQSTFGCLVQTTKSFALGQSAHNT